MEKIIFNIGMVEFIFETSITEKENQEIILSAKDNDRILWKIIFENITIEKVKSLFKINNELFCVIDNSINEIDINNGKILKKEYFGNTPIDTIIVDNNYMYILLYYYEFDKQKYFSNILCINNNLKIKWFAELPETNDIYTYLEKREKNIIGNTWNGLKCIINRDNGKIMNKIFTK